MACAGNPLPSAKFQSLKFLTTSRSSTTHWGPGTQQASFWEHLWAMIGCTSLCVICPHRVALVLTLSWTEHQIHIRKHSLKGTHLSLDGVLVGILASYSSSLISNSLASHLYFHLPALLSYSSPPSPVCFSIRYRVRTEAREDLCEAGKGGSMEQF